MNRKVSILLGVLSALAAGCTSTDLPKPAEPEPEEGVCVTPAEDLALMQEVLDLVNAERAAEELPPVELSPELSDVAEDYACEMIEQGFFAHQNPATLRTAGERLTAAGYIYYAMGEVLAVGQQTPEEVVADWMASPDHREILLFPFWQECGIAVRRDTARGHFWVQEFAEPVELSE